MLLCCKYGKIYSFLVTGNALTKDYYDIGNV